MTRKAPNNVDGMRGCLLSCAILGYAAAGIPASSPLVLWQGRTLVNASNGAVAFDLEGVSATVVVSGATMVTAAVVSTFLEAPPTILHGRSLQDSSFPKFGVYRVFVDGVRGLNVTVFPGAANVTLASGLDPSRPHTIRAVYTTDPVYNVWPNVTCVGCYQSVVSLSTDGVFGSPPAVPQRTMLLVGDSITAGNNLLKPCDNATTNDYSRSYGQQLCDVLNVSCQTVAISSKGLLHNCCDDLPVTVPDFMMRTLAQDPSPALAWPWSQFTPQAVLINLGTNDAGHIRTPALVAAFEARYVQLLVNITTLVTSSRLSQGQSPPHFFLGVGPITQVYAPWVLNAAATAASQFGVTSTFVNFTGAPLDGCGHPGIAGHNAMAGLLTPIVARVMGWGM